MSLTVAEVIAELRRAGMPADHRPGENGVASVCPVCVREMVWHEGMHGWACDGGCDPARIADAVFFASGGDRVPPAVSPNGRVPFALYDLEDLLVQPDLAYLIEGLVPLSGQAVIFG